MPLQGQGQPVSTNKKTLATAGAILVCALVFALLVVGSVAGCGLYKNWRRGQARADAQNRVRLTTIQIQTQQQQAKVVAAQNGIVKQQAYQRYLQSVGVREAQDEISKTLTPQYIQWDSIQALLKLGESGRNNTVVYMPAGQAGVPLITAQASRGK